MIASGVGNPGTYPDGAVEVLSEGKEHGQRDLEVKRGEYAEAGIQEYWIVDPETERILVLALDSSAYHEHGAFGPGQAASSVLLEGFSVDVRAVLQAGDGP